MEKYRDLALKLGAVHAKLISSKQIHFDKRALLKCRWGCEFDGRCESIRCGSRGIGFDDAVEIIRAYKHVLLLHHHETRILSHMVLKLESQAFVDGYYWAFGMRTCDYCKKCYADTERGCLHPEKVRPCEQAYGIDVYKTVRELGLPCEPLKHKDDKQNRYGFVLLD